MQRDWHSALSPTAAERRGLFAEVLDLLDRFVAEGDTIPVTPGLTAEALRGRLAGYDFAQPLDAPPVLEDVVEMLRDGTVHMNHPRYFGLFNPAPAFPGVLADLITAVFNPQLAVWSHAPAAVEIERHVIAFVGGLVDLPAETVAGHFTSGGAEANATATVLAATRAAREFGERGARAFPGQPVLYASEESHLAWFKIAHACGLGRRAVRLVRTDGSGRLDPAALQEGIERDRKAGDFPILAVATAGTTNAGMIDPLPAIGDIAAREGLHFHVDAAWGGAAAFSDALRPHLAGIERAHSVTVDAHKWLSVPMGAGMFLCADNAGLHAAFKVATSFMPQGLAASDPYTHSMQWSRRFIGLKLFLTLSMLGRRGYAALIDAQTALGNSLRRRLAEAGWKNVNDTPLPVVCFRDPRGTDPAAIAARVVEGGRAWISAARFVGGSVLRACITSFRTRESDLEELVRRIGEVRAQSERSR